MKRIFSYFLRNVNSNAVTNSNYVVNDTYLSDLKIIAREINQFKLMNGKLLGVINMLHRKEEILREIQIAEFQVFSQWGDDGIINFLVNYLDIEKKEFVEFGVQNYTECNTRFLLINDNWRGLIIDGSADYINSVRNEDIAWQYDLTAVDSFVTAENINLILTANNFKDEIGLLHIDIDGNDYWIWKAINVIKPAIVILEYNSIFGYSKPWTVPYDAAFNRTKAHYSNLFFGTSILSACDLAEEKGYDFIGCNSNGNNAYFVRKDKMKKLSPKSPQEGYVLSKFAESRDLEGNLTYIKGDSRLQLLSGLNVFNSRKGELETI